MSDYRSSYSKSLALIVGVNTYSDPRFVPLGQAEADANSFADLLSAPPYSFEITKLLGAAATKNAILQELYKLRRTQPDDRLIVYFAGHGYTLSDRLGNEAGYLACADTVPEQDFTALEMEDVISLTRHAPAKHISFIFDACFSGQALGLTRAPSVTSDKLMQRRAYQVISAGAGDQTVSDYSSMTGRMVEALKTNVLVRDGLVTMGELGLFLQQTITADSLQTQIPQFGHIRGSQGGDFVFSVESRTLLPADLEDALNSSRANTRWGAVADLIELAHGATGDLCILARDRLTNISKTDPDERVRNAAQSYFDEIAAGGDGTITQGEMQKIRLARDIALPSLTSTGSETPAATSTPSRGFDAPAAPAATSQPAAKPEPLVSVSKSVQVNAPAAKTGLASLPIPIWISGGVLALVALVICGLMAAGIMSLFSENTQAGDTLAGDVSGILPTLETMQASDLWSMPLGTKVFESPEEWTTSGVLVVDNAALTVGQPDSDAYLQQLNDIGRTTGWTVTHYGNCTDAVTAINFSVSLFTNDAAAKKGLDVAIGRGFSSDYLTNVVTSEETAAGWLSYTAACEEAENYYLYEFIHHNVLATVSTAVRASQLTEANQEAITREYASLLQEQIDDALACRTNGDC